MAHPPGLRCRSDEKLRDTLLGQHDLRRSIEEIERKHSRLETRRQLLAASIRLTPSLAPDIHRVVEHCRERLGLELPLELFVYASPNYNAAAARPEDGRGFVLFASSLLESFTDDELAFVIGHELGHHVFAHHEIPVGALLSPAVSVTAAQALELFAWSRFAEISADRAGLYCCNSLEAAGRALFKLASGLRHPLTEKVVDVMLDQLADIHAAGDRRREDLDRQDWLSTHPFSPLRIRAGQLFMQSQLVRPDGLSLDDLELQVEELLLVMDLGYLNSSTPEAKAMRRLLLAGGMLIAAASGQVTDGEATALDELLGDGTVNSKLDVEALRQDLDHRVQAVLELTTKGRRLQLLRDLSLVAQADGCTSPQERDVLEDLARRLHVDVGVLPELTACAYELD